MLVCDVDGTVCESCQVIDDETSSLLKALDREVVFLSGTDAPELYRMIPNTESYVLANSGAECWRYGSKVYGSPVLDCLPAVRHIVKSLPFPKAEILDRGSQITVSLIGRFASLEEKKSFDPDGFKRSRYIEVFRQSLPGLHIVPGGTSSIDIGGIDKLDGLKRFLEYRNLNPREVLYIGDSFDGNDKPLLGYLPCVQVLNPEQFRDFLKWI